MADNIIQPFNFNDFNGYIDSQQNNDLMYIDTLNKLAEQLKAQGENLMADATKTHADYLAKINELNKAHQDSRLAQEKAYLNKDEALLKAKITLEEQLTDLTESRIRYEKESYKLELKLAQLKNSELNKNRRALERQKKDNALKEKIDQALLKASTDLTTRQGKMIKKRIENEMALQKTQQIATDFLSTIPKLGQQGSIFNLAKSMSTLTQVTKEDGTVINRMSTKNTAQENLAVAYTGLATVTTALADIAKQMNKTIEDTAKLKGDIDTRLYGSRKNQKMLGSYFSKIAYDASATMMSPLIKQETLINNINKVVEMGIARDVQQVAMLDTIKDKIATTFNAFDGTLLRLIRIQDNNTTAARLGMEASLTELLNQMYENTSYLKDVASSVRSSLAEAEALMGGETAVEFEYQVQKWLGSLYSVGMSQGAISGISSALGNLASGNIEGLTNGGFGNLLIMAANKGNISLGDALAQGLDSSQTNVLLDNVVAYLHELAQDSAGNLVVQQQIAKVFGMTASDLKAAQNITRTYNGVSNQMKTLFGLGGDYNTFLATLYDRAGTMGQRISMAEKLENLFGNVKYSTALSIGSNPVLYLTTKIADLLDSFVGGVPIPFINTAFGGIDTKLTVANIMRSGSLIGGLTQSLTSMISSAINNGSGLGWNGQDLLRMVGVPGKIDRKQSASKSGAATIINASLQDLEEASTANANSNNNTIVSEATDEGSPDRQIFKNIEQYTGDIYALFKNIILNNALQVYVTNSTNTNSGTTPTSAFTK